MSKFSEILQSTLRYYSNKVASYGATPRGVAWNSDKSQEIRFVNLLKISIGNVFFVNDIGCGYGALYTFLVKNGFDCGYFGIGVSQSMVDQAKLICGQNKKYEFIVGHECSRIADYSVASGIKGCEESIFETLGKIKMVGRKGFSFNCLTTCSDK